MNKRILSIILVLTMLIGVVAVMPITVTADDTNVTVWSGDTAESFAGGDGSSDNPYQIANGEQLALLADLVTNKKDGNYNRAHYVLTADIVLNDMPHVSTWYQDWNDDAYEPENMITPIGTWSTATSSFGGTFDGQGHTITGAYFYSESGDNHGLFGAVQGGAVIKNFALVNSLFGNEGGNIAAIAGTTDRSNEGDILIENVYVDAYVYSGGANAGGIMGTLSNSQSGYNAGTVTVSRVTFNGQVHGSNYAAGIIADARNVIFYVVDCLVLANIKATSTANGQYSAGFVSRSKNNLDLISEYAQVVTNCILAGGSVTASKSTKYNRAYISSSNGTSKPLSEYNLDAVKVTDVRNADDETSSDINQTLLYGSYDGTDAIDWEEWDANAYSDEEYETAWAHPMYDIARPVGIAENFDILPVEPPKQFANGSGTEEDPYIIANADDLAILSQLSQTDSLADTYFELTADITLTGENNHTPIGNWDYAFGGKFDGNGHTISGMHIDSTSDSKALFGVIQGGAEIRNLALVDAYVKGGAGENDGCTAALVGQTNRGSSDEIIIDNIYIDAQVIGNGKGIAGVIGNNSNAKDSYTPADVTITNVVVTGSITGNNEYVAGFVGTARDAFITLENCANYATVTSSKSRVAGLIAGETGGYSISNCISAGRLTGSATVFAVAYHSGDAAEETERVIDNAYVVDGIASGGSSSGADAGAIIVELTDISKLIGAGATIPEGFTARAGDVALPATVAANLNTTVIYGLGLLDGASIRISEPSGLRFTAVLGADYLNSFEGQDITFGIIIAPTDFVEAAGEFTIEALEGINVTSGSKYKDIVAEKCASDPEADGYYEFSAVLAPIQETNYDRAFSARAYVKVDGVYYYSEYDEDYNSRSIEEVAQAAYKDTKPTQTDKYQYALNEEYQEEVEGEIITTTREVFSPYTEAQRKTLMGFIGLGEQ